MNPNANIGFEHTPFAPFDPSVHSYFIWSGNDRSAIPYEFTGWMDETLSWKENCYIHSFLSAIGEAIPVKGPDAEKLMSYMCVNNFSLERFPVGRAKHVIACTAIGTVASHGMCLRLAEDEFLTYFMSPSVEAHMYSGRFNVQPHPSDFERDFIFQLAGPRSLEVVEQAIKRDIHDLEFMEFCDAEVLGHPVRILRMGMGGSLAYEIHGATENLVDVYNEVLRVGAPYGIRRLGVRAYMCNHTENGFPQNYFHFLADYQNDPNIMQLFAMSAPKEGEGAQAPQEIPLFGSLTDQGKDAYFNNPIECGWEKMISWDHDFVGKEALEKLAADPSTRTVATLEWNAEDVLKVFATLFDDEAGVAKPMAIPQDYEEARNGCLADKILDAEGNLIGKSTGRIYTLYYKKMISMAFIDRKFAEEGTEVTVLWGEPGTRQMPVRAKVARYPYLDLTRNEDYDVESIPRYQA